MTQHTKKFAAFYARYSKFLPSKQVAVFIATTLSIIGLVFAGLTVTGTKYTVKNLQAVTVGQAVTQDTDGDGVADWEERLFETNPESRDSDNDGIPDATEIANKRDIIAAENGYSSSVPYTPNETDKFARDLFVTYNAVASRGALSDTAKSSLASAASSGSLATLPQVTLYSAADLQIIPSNPDSNLEYRKRVASLSQAGSRVLGSEFVLINQGIEKNNGDILRDAAKNTKVYSSYASALLKVPVPINQVENHIRLLNNLSYIVSVLPYIDALENDVVRGISLYTIYVKSYQDMFSTFEAIGKTQ